MRRHLLPLLLLLAIDARAQFVPPVPKSVTGGRALNRTTAIPLPSPKQQWVRATSLHFVTLSGAGERRTREVVTELETLAAALRQVDPRFAGEVEPTRIILFARRRDAQPYFDLVVGGAHTPGAFVTNSEGYGTMLIDASRQLSDRTVFHELVHNLLANSGARLPLWLEEGVADYFSTAEVKRQSVRIAGRISEHSYALRNRPLMPLAALFAVQGGSDVASTPFFYAQSWAVVDWMMRTDRAAFYAFLSDVGGGTPSIDALQRNFHVDAGSVERSIQGGPLRPSSVISIHVDSPTEAPVTEPLQRADIVIELATFLGGFEATRADAQRFLEDVVRSDPQNGQAFAAMAALRAKEKELDAATKLYEQALQLAPADAGIRLSFAESLLGNAIGPFSGTVDVDAEAALRFRRARLLAAAALAAGGDAARANAVIGTSYLAGGDVKAGIEALQRAHALRPGRYDVALNLYALLLRAGDREAATNLYAQITSRARTPQAIFAARAVYVREQLAITNRLIAENRTDEAIAILHELIAATPDPNARMDLERQLIRLREIGDANRQIATYNEAVNASNRGETRKAIGILNRLLETATDPAVIQDATALRAQLQKRLKGMRRS